MSKVYTVCKFRERKAWIGALSLLGAFALLGCVERAPQAPRLDVDLVGGAAGSGSEPLPARGCSRPAEGCPCRSGQPAVSCELEPGLDQAGQTTCHEGTRQCRDGVWSACESVFTFLAGPAHKVSALVDPDCHSPCNACAINCYQVVDPLDPVEGGLTIDNSSCLKWAFGGGIELINNYDPQSEGSGCFDDPLPGEQDAGLDDGGLDDGGVDPDPDAGVADDGGADPDPDAAEPDAAEPEQCAIEQCQDKLYACGDCQDNDGDGLTDMDDPECLGPCQNAEETFAGEIPGGNAAPCLHDCYFDQDTGSGNDDCRWDHRCDPEEPETGCEFDPDVNIVGTGLTCNELGVAQSQACEDFCAPLTPPGCDFFGCCELPAGTGNYVWIGSEDENGDPSCDSDSLFNPERCHSCTPLGDPYFKPCGPCELCAGMTELPPECQDPEPVLAEAGSYIQFITFNECTGNQKPDWRDLRFEAHIPEGASLLFSGCTMSSLEQGCAPELLAEVTSSNACETAEDCAGGGYCAADGRCQLLTSSACESDEQCPADASCLAGLCTYPGQSVDMAEALSPGSNYLPYMAVQIELFAGPGQDGSPVLRQWMLTYSCVNVL